MRHRRFKAQYGTNKNKPNAFGKCVSAHGEAKAEDEAEATQEAKENAAKKCKKERDALDPSPRSRQKYGTEPRTRRTPSASASRKLAKAKSSS